MAVVHADQERLSKEIGFTLREAGEVALLNDSTVAAADTVAGVKAAVNAAVVHAEYEPYRSRVNRAVDLGSYSQELTDALINPLTTVTGLVNLTQASLFTQPRQLILD